MIFYPAFSALIHLIWQHAFTEAHGLRLRKKCLCHLWEAKAQTILRFSAGHLPFGLQIEWSLTIVYENTESPDKRARMRTRLSGLSLFTHDHVQVFMCSTTIPYLLSINNYYDQKELLLLHYKRNRHCFALIFILCGGKRNRFSVESQSKKRAAAVVRKICCQSQRLLCLLVICSSFIIPSFASG